MQDSTPKRRGVFGHSLVDGYEALRAQVLGVSPPGLRGQGLSLFMHNGMAAWMEAWSCRVPEPILPRRAHEKRPSFPQGLQTEVASLLAEIAVSIGMEQRL